MENAFHGIDAVWKIKLKITQKENPQVSEGNTLQVQLMWVNNIE